ncbi:DinB family protein [Reichenbachiella sp.]|uniref:DinB family protein n=1 Tax=Reichenbachiella sp. TaxID=2184521 RepID=UPI003B59D4A3
MKLEENIERRNFLRNSGVLAAGLLATPLTGFVQEENFQNADSIYMIGPKEGYSPRVGTLLSTMTMMRAWVVDSVKDLTVEQLDFQIDDQSNSIGAMLWHLAATERYYQLNTFDEMEWGSWSDDIKQEWDLPMGLGDMGREKIKDYDIDFYLMKLSGVRAETEKEFAKRDDDWLMKAEPFFGKQMTNNHCKWFHVCEHESNHNGQIKFIKKRLPS